MGVNFTIKGFSLRSFFERHYLFFSVIVALVLCFGYMTGSDWTWYEPVYYRASLDNMTSYGDEPAYYYLMLLFRQLGFGFFGFIIIMKLLHFFITIKLLKKISYNYYFSLFIYIAHYGLFMFIDNPLRYMIAMNFIYMALYYMYDGKKTLPLILSFLALPFHYTAILFIPMLFFLRMKWNLNFILILSILTLLLNGFFIAKILSLFPASLEFYFSYILKIDNYNTIFTIGTLANILQVSFLLFYRKEIDYNSNKLNLNAIYVYMILFNLSLIIPVFFRFMIFIAPVYCASLSFFASVIFKKKAKRVMIMAGAYIVFFASYATLDTVTGKYAYLPYSNYLVNKYFGKEYEYGYRSSYNLNEFEEGKLIY